MGTAAARFEDTPQNLSLLDRAQSLLALLEVVFGIALAWLGAGEAPGATVLTGGTLVIGALVVNELLGWKQRNA